MKESESQNSLGYILEVVLGLTNSGWSQKLDENERVPKFSSENLVKNGFNGSCGSSNRIFHEYKSKAAFSIKHLKLLFF